MLATVLLVDDNKEFIDNIKDVLEEEDCTVITAHNGEEACNLVERHSFDLVLMDIKMPGMNGVDSFLRMKENKPDIKVALFTAYALEELIQKAKANGVVAVFKKPLDIEHLIEIIKVSQKGPVGKRVLIADDDAAFCENLHESLTAYGYHATTVCDAHGAILEARINIYDVVLLDVKMPEFSGLEIYRKIKEVNPSAIIILMTGYAEEMKALIHQAIQERAYALLPKPIDMNHLFQVLRRVAEDTKRVTTRQKSMEQ